MQSRDCDTPNLTFIYFHETLRFRLRVSRFGHILMKYDVQVDKESALAYCAISDQCWSRHRANRRH